jgi:transposase
MYRWGSMLDKFSLADRSFRNEPRRRFTREFKRQLVESLLVSPDSLARVARDNDLNHNQLSKWRRQYQEGLFGEASPVRLVPVSVTAPPPPIVVPMARVEAELAAPRVGLELVLPKGRILVHAAPDIKILRLVIEAMQ